MGRTPESFVSCAEAETIALGVEFARRLVSGSVVALIGELGSGKTHFIKGICRGLGVADMARAILYKEKHKANGELALHVLETMHAFLKSSKTGKQVQIKNRCKMPELLNTDREEWRML